MVARTVSRGKRDDFYYVCRTYRTRPRICDHGTHYRAEIMEGRIAKMVSDLVVNRDRLMAHMREKIEALRQDLRRDYPEAEAARIADKLDKIDRAKKNYRRQAAEELISFG